MAWPAPSALAAANGERTPLYETITWPHKAAMTRAPRKTVAETGMLFAQSYPGTPPFAWSNDGDLLVTRVKGGVAAWDAETGHALREFHHRGRIEGLSIHGDKLAVVGDDRLTIWSLETGDQLVDVEGPAPLNGIAWSPNGKTLAGFSRGGDVFLWDARRLNEPRTISMRAIRSSLNDILLAISWSNDSRRLAGASYYTWVFDSVAGDGGTFESDSGVYDIAWSPRRGSNIVAAATSRNTVEIWDAASSRLLTRLEAHSEQVGVAFSTDGRFLASIGRSEGMIVRRCRDWARVAQAPAFSEVGTTASLAFRPRRHEIAFPQPATRTIQLWRLDKSKLEKRARRASTVAYKSAKIVLVGDSGVGKTGLGWRIAHEQFKEHSSTHGQQFWVVDQLSARRGGTQREAVLWDLAGQPDYRLIHALFVDDADIALLLFDPTHPTNPLHGVEFWTKQLRLCRPALGDPEKSAGPIAALVAARTDRGTARLTKEELADFADRCGLAGPFYTSALSGEGVDDVVAWLSATIPWDRKPATITSSSFKKIKDLALVIKERLHQGGKAILTTADLRDVLEREKRSKFPIDEIDAAVGHLANHGYVSILRTSKGDSKILLLPELLNNLAASFVLEARKNRKGLGSLREQDLLESNYEFRELDHLSDDDKEIMIDSTASMFLKHNICFRESDPLNNQSYLIFPELINLKRPLIDDDDTEEDVSYLVVGSIENVYSSLVVLLGYTNTFARTNQWRNQARYEVGDGLVCGFRLEQEDTSELSFVLYFGKLVGEAVRGLFRSLFETFLSRHEVTMQRFEPIVCSRKHVLNRSVVRELAAAGEREAFCNRCGERLALPDPSAPIELAAQAEDVRSQSRVADLRSRFEQALFRLSTFAKEHNQTGPKCFISYAWGDAETERWVERNLATDLLKAGIGIVLDRWENARIGSSIPRFVELISSSDCVLVVGTPTYREKYGNADPDRGYIVAAEGDLIGRLMIGSEEEKRRVLPVLLSGTARTSFPNLLQGRTYSDFRKDADYFSDMLVLALSLYDIEPTNPLAKEIRASVEDAFL